MSRPHVIRIKTMRFLKCSDSCGHELSVGALSHVLVKVKKQV